MKLQKLLDESGYTAAAEELETIKQQRAAFAEMSRNVPPERLDEHQDLLNKLDEAIARGEASLKAEYEEAVKHVDAVNDMEFAGEDLLERAELVAEHFANEMDRPDVAEWIRKLMAGENPGPPPQP